ncbi:hypothetical protein M758_2G021900 [Ceratodon purpureus]|nr:hypothetical protein M758_2G021900 [Ceratodon purpureus]
MEKDFDGCKSCTPCTRAYLESHGDLCQSNAEQSLGAPSFLKMITEKHLSSNGGFVRLPSSFMEDYGRRIGTVVTINGPSGWVGQVTISYDGGFGFCGGWKQFVVYHNIEAGDYILCTLIADSKFTVKIYNEFGCEKVHFSYAPTAEGSKAMSQMLKDGSFVSESLTLSTSAGGREFALPNLGGKRKTLDEVKSLSGIGKKLCMQQLGLDTLGVENGNNEVETKPHIVPERFQFKGDHDSDPQSPQYPDADAVTGTGTPLRIGPRSEECSSSDSEKKSVEIEDDIDVYNKSTRKRAHRAVYETEMRRFMAMEAAQAYETSNPRTMLVVNKTAITKSQSYFSSVFARKWFPEERAQLLLIDEADNKWAVTFIPTASHMVLGAGWAKFVRDNKLEKGDVVVFELKNPSTLTLIVHIFRVKDYTFVRVANLSKVKHPESSTVSTPPKREIFTGNARVKYAAESRKDNESPSTSDKIKPKSQSPMAPQYAAVAKYFASRASPSIHGSQKACDGVAQEGQGLKANDAYNKEESGVSRHRGEFCSAAKQELPYVMPAEASPLPVSQSRESEGSLMDLNEKTSPSSKQQATQPVQPFMMMSGGTSGSMNYFPPVTVPPLQLQYLLSQQGHTACGMPPQLGGGLYLAPQGQLPCAMTMQEGTSFVDFQQVQPPQTALNDNGHHGVLVPPGLPKEVEFPGPINEQPPGRFRDRWEIKPRRPRPPTDAERQRAMDEAYEFWTPNPHVMVALKPSQVYAGFSLTLRCAALPDETRDATLIDSTGQTWTCKWLVNHSGRRLSAGWKRFAVDHLLEEGDVCVFEMIDRMNLTLLIHIFRIELDDHVSEPIEVRKSEDRRVSVDPTKRKRKSRAKPKGLGPPVPKLPAYSGCRMEKLGESSSPLRGANMLPNMPSYKYTALQSRRRPVTMEERRRAELGARNLNTKNPSVTVVMRNSSVYCHFLVSIPSAFAKQWLPRKLVRVTLMDSGGQKSTARWAGNRKKSACLKSFREFSLSHCLEEGDALVFELMDANPNNPVFLVHVFRVVELLSPRISPKDWENHYKLDVMIGTIKPVVPLQAYQRHYDGESRILQAYRPMSSDSDEDQDEDEPSQTSTQQETLPQLLPKSKTKAIYSALVRRKIIDNQDYGHSDYVQYGVGEGTSRSVETSIRFGYGLAEVYADKATHISQLERLGRQQISRDIMPILKGNMGSDGHAVESKTITPAVHRKQSSYIHDKADTEMSVHASHPENGAGQLVQICEPLASIVPKSEPVEEVVLPPKESKRIRRKTTMRREGRDDFLQITFGEITNWQPENSHRNRQENLETVDVHKKALIGTEMTLCHSEIRGTSQDLECNQETEHPVRFQLLSCTTDLPPLDRVGTDGGVHWLKPKPEHAHGGD